jgi:uncharacterized damage-inducible protein DinB
MKREDLLFRLKAVAASVLDLFEQCPRDQLHFRPADGMRDLLELGNHFASVPLVDLAIIQGSPGNVVETIEDTLHGAGPTDWIEIFDRGVKAAEEYFERLTEEDFETKTTRAHYGPAEPQCVWLLELINHVYHHRGQLYVYLRMLHVPVGVEHLYT